MVSYYAVVVILAISLSVLSRPTDPTDTRAAIAGTDRHESSSAPLLWSGSVNACGPPAGVGEPSTLANRASPSSASTNLHEADNAIQRSQPNTNSNVKLEELSPEERILKRLHKTRTTGQETSGLNEQRRPVHKLWRRGNGRQSQAGPSAAQGSGAMQSQWLSREDALRKVGLPGNDPDADAISEFVRRNQPLVPSIQQMPQLKADLLAIYQHYQEVIPTRGDNLDLADNAMEYHNLLGNIGRDRFRYMNPIISFLLANKETLELDNVRVAFLEAVQTRFGETEQAMSPTREELLKYIEDDRTAHNKGQLSLPAFDVRARGYRKALDKRLKDATLQRSRILQDLGLVNAFEKELEWILRHV